MTYADKWEELEQNWSPALLDIEHKIIPSSNNQFLSECVRCKLTFYPLQLYVIKEEPWAIKRIWKHCVHVGE